MSTWIPIVISAFSFTLAIINFLWSISLSKRQEELSKDYIRISTEQLKISQGQIEIEMANQLSNAKKYVDNWETMCFDFMTKEEKLKAVNKKKDFVIEEALNSYEVICQKYLDGKTDIERFEKSYRSEISNLFGIHSIFKEKLDGDSSPFKAIKKVYNKWNNRE